MSLDRGGNALQWCGGKKTFKTKVYRGKTFRFFGKIKKKQEDLLWKKVKSWEIKQTNRFLQKKIRKTQIVCDNKYIFSLKNTRNVKNFKLENQEKDGWNRDFNNKMYEKNNNK